MKIAIVSTMNLPTPAVRGGAVETLTTYIVEENEKKQKLDIDLYTMYDYKIDVEKYKNTKIIQIKINIIEKLFQKIINFKNRILKKKSTYNILYTKTVKLIIKQKYDKIIIENNMFVYDLIKDAVKTDLIYHMHNDFNKWDKTEENYKKVAKTASKILVVSEYIKNRVNNVEKTDKVDVLYNAIDTDIYNSNAVINCREKYNINDSDIVIGYCGRISKEKGILELVKAVKKVNTNKNIKLLIVGSQWYDELKEDRYMLELKKEIKEIEDKVIFTGYIKQENMPSIYKMIDILVIPSIVEEAFGCVAIEGMAMGKPLIVAKSGGLPEIVKKEYGDIIEKNSQFIDNMAKSIERLVENDKIRMEYGKNAKNEFESNVNYHKEQYFENFYNYITE